MLIINTQKWKKYTHAYTHTHTHIYIYTFVYVWMNACIKLGTHTHTYIYIYIYSPIYIYKYIWVPEMSWHTINRSRTWIQGAKFKFWTRLGLISQASADQLVLVREYSKCKSNLSFIGLSGPMKNIYSVEISLVHREAIATLWRANFLGWSVWIKAMTSLK